MIPVLCFILFFWVRFGGSCVRVTFAYRNTIRGQIVILLTIVHIRMHAHRNHGRASLCTETPYTLVGTNPRCMSHLNHFCWSKLEFSEWVLDGWYILNSFAQRTKFISDANIYRIFSLICVFFFVSLTNIFRRVNFLKISVQTNSPLQFCTNTHLILAIDESIVFAMLKIN